MMSGRAILRACSVSVLALALSCSPSRQSLQNKGSDTMVELAQAWAEAYPAAVVEVSGGGTSVGISALISGTVDIGNASRPLADKEIAEAKEKTGRTPVQHVVAYDALAIYVHKDNPIEEITLEQLKDIYGDGGKITKWSDLGIKVPGCDSDEIQRISRQNNSGTYEYFREHVLGKAVNFKLGSIDASGSKDLVTLVGKTPCAIGYSGMGYKTPDVKFVKVRNKAGQGVLPSIAATHDGSYPISRPLYMYTLSLPQDTKAGDEKEVKLKAAEAYIDWIRSDPGQTICANIGYVPLKAEERAKSAGGTAAAATKH